MKNLFQLFALLPFCLFAQKKDSVTLENLVCTAQFAPTDARNAVHQIKVLDEKTIARRAANNLEELLATETSFRFSSDLILGSGLQINGIGGENVKVLIDGVPVIGKLNGNVDLSQISLANVQRIEVVQGSLSAVYGSNASGGVINIITKKSQTKPFTFGVQSQVENIGIKTLSAQIGVQKGKFLLQLSGNVYDFSGYPVDSLRSSLWNPKRQYTGKAMLKYYLSDNQQLNYSYSLMDEKVSNLGDIKRPKYKPYAFDEYYFTQRNDHALNYEGKFGKNNLQSTFAFNNFDRKKNAYRTDLEANIQDFVLGEQDTSRFNAWLSRTTFSRAINKNLSLLSGVEFYHENALGKKIQDSTENKLGFAQMSDLGTFVGGKFDFLEKKLALQPTVRYSYNSKYDAPLTPSFNALFQINSNWKIRGSYARGFRAPSLKELYFNFIDVNHYIVGQTNIKAEKSHNIVVNPSFSKTYGKFNFLAEGNIFYNDIQNRIILAEYETLKYRYDNLAEYKTKGAGLNLTLSYDEFVTWKSSAVYTAYYNTARDEQPGLPIYLYSPDFSSDLTVTIPSIRLTMNVLYRHTGAMPTYNFGKNGVLEEGRLSSWNLLNATVSKHFFKGKINITTGVKNILNIQNIVSQGAIGVGHSANAREIPVNFGKSYFVKMAVNI